MVKNLQVNDLKALSMNKKLPETLKKVALKDLQGKERTAEIDQSRFGFLGKLGRVQTASHRMLRTRVFLEADKGP